MTVGFLTVLDGYVFMADQDTVDLDKLSRQIVAAVAAADGEVKTSDLRADLLGDVENARQKIHYRISEYLEPHEFVETHQPDGGPGEFPAKRVSITDRGQEFVNTHDVAMSQATAIADDRVAALEERIEALEAENEALRERVAESDAGGGSADGGTVDEDVLRELGDRVATLEENVQAQADRFGDVSDEIAAVNTRIDSANNDLVALKNYPLIKSPNSIQGINRSLALSSALRELLMAHTEITDDMIREEFNNRMAILDDADELVPTPD